MRANSQSDANTTTLRFGAAISELERIVIQLETDGELELEDALDLYERGVTLVMLARQRLEGARLRLREEPTLEETDPIGPTMKSDASISPTS